MFYHALVPIQAVINNLESVEDLKQHCCNVCACDSAKQSGACRRKISLETGTAAARQQAGRFAQL